MGKQFYCFFVFVLFILVIPACPQDEKEKEEAAPAESYPPRAIINAAYRGDAEMVKKILATGPDPDVRDDLGGTALHDAVFQDNLEVIRLLLDYGFDINAVVPSNGYTPLHYCVWAGNLPALNLLLRYQADRTIKAKDGLTPLEKATRDGKREFILALSPRPPRNRR
jgi:ankyrin repeat protein